MAYVRKALPLVQIPHAILARSDLSGNEKIVLGAIAFLCRKNGCTKAHNSFMAMSIGLTEKAVRNIIYRLKQRGFLAVHDCRNCSGQVWKRDFTILYPQSLK